MNSQPGHAVTALEGRFELALFWIAAAAALVPLFSADYLPLQDTPQHLAAIRVLHSYDDPAFAFEQYFTLHPLKTQYLAYYVVADLLTHLAPLYWVNTLLIGVVIVALPFSVRSLSRALGGDGSAGLLALPLTYNAHLILGFVNFLAAVPLCLYGLSLAARQRRGFSAWRAAWLGLITVVTFVSHVVPFAFLLLGAALLAFPPKPPRWRFVAPRLATLVPAVAVAILWSLASPAGQATVGAASGRASFRPAARALEELPMWLTDVFVDGADLVMLKLLAALLALAVTASFVRRLGAVPAPALWLLPLAAGLLYFLAPAGYQWIWPIAPRFALLSVLFALPLLPAARHWVRRTLLSAAFGLSLAHTAHAQQAFEAFGNEVGALDAALEAIPPGQRVAGLIFSRGSRHVRFSPFLHMVAHYQAQKGGAVMFTFADFPQSPFSFREERRPPRVPPRWEWQPGRVNPARHLAYYDYVLVRGGPGRIAGQPRAFQRVFRSRHWSVWQRVRPGTARPD